MIYLVLSDIHGNLPALEAILKAEKDQYDSIIQLGDVVNYGPWSNECVQLVHTLPAVINLAGNHEEYYIKGAYSNPGKISELFFKETYPGFKEHDKIREYEESLILNGTKFIHTLDDQYIYRDSLADIETDICLGHSHRQYHNELNKFAITNPGSVGQNRELINMAAYAVYDTDKNKFELKQLKYDIDIVINEMKSRKFPEACINYYKEKKRA